MLRFARPYRAKLIWFVVTIVVLAIVDVFPPLLLRSLIDKAIPEGSRDLVMLLAAAAAAIAIAAALELAVPTEFPRGPIAIARRTVAERSLATRRVGPLLSVTVARRVGLAVAELPVGRPPRWTRVIAIAARPAVIAVVVRAITARLELTLFAIAVTVKPRPVATRRRTSCSIAPAGATPSAPSRCWCASRRCARVPSPTWRAPPTS